MANAVPESCPAPARVLVVDDDAPTVRMIQFLLKEEGLFVSSAADGDTAMAEYLKASPDLILLNVIMPGTDGFRLYSRFRELGYQGPVMFVTARPDVPELLMELKLDVAGCLVKPLHPDEMLPLVWSALESGRDAEEGRLQERAAVSPRTADLGAGYLPR